MGRKQNFTKGSNRNVEASALLDGSLGTVRKVVS